MNDRIVNVVKKLVQYDTEREWFEFKMNLNNVQEIGEYISALSNSAAINRVGSGYLIWGVNDKTHMLEGTSFKFNRNVNNEPLKHYLMRQLNPDINFLFHDISIDHKRIVVLEISCAALIPTSFNRERYLRIGSSKVNLKKYPNNEANLFEALRVEPRTILNTESTNQDLTFQQLQMYYGAKGVKLNNSSFKRNFSFYTKDGKFNLLSQLLSDDSGFPIRVAIFSGTSKADKLFSVREFGHKCVLYSLEEVLQYGDVINILQSDESERIVERKETSLFENNAFREAIVNSFLHNNWINGDGPMISVFSNRIEILSRGTLPSGQSKEGFYSGESIPVNRKLSEIFLQLRISEKTGRGVPTIIEKYGKEIFSFKENSIIVNIPFKWINIMDINSTVVSKRENLNDTQKNILLEIRNNPNIKVFELAIKLDRGRSTVNVGLSVLRKKGYIERVGSNKTGYWRVIEE